MNGYTIYNLFVFCFLYTFRASGIKELQFALMAEMAATSSQEPYEHYITCGSNIEENPPIFNMKTLEHYL